MVSVIIPIYNASAYLQTCFDSLVSQSYEEWEAILVDDGSTDDSGEICRKYITNDSRIKYHYQDNKGVSSARNLGLSYAQGKWVIFLDADDELPQDALMSYSDHFDAEVDFIIGGYEVFNENGEKTYGIPERIDMILEKEAAISLLYRPLYYRYLGYIAGKCFRNEFIQQWKIRFNRDIFYNEDRLFTTQYLCHCKSILFFTQPVYHYFEHSGSAMSAVNSSFNPKFITDLDGFNEMKDAILEAHCSKELIKMANQGIASSFWRIRGLMKRFHISSPKLRLSIHLKALRGLTLLPYLTYIVRPFFWNIFRRLGFKVKSA